MTDAKESTPLLASGQVFEQDESRDPDTILRNVRLIATKWNFFIFIVHPIFAWSLMLYIALHLNTTAKSIAKAVPVLTISRQFLAGFFYTLFAFMVTLEVGHNRIPARLKETGYVQVWSRKSMVQYAVTLGFFASATYFVLKNRWLVSGFGTWTLRIYIAVTIFLAWTCMTLSSLGPVLWFTLRA